MTPERKAKIEHVLNNRQPDLTVVLENVHDPHNISAVMRSCDAVGVQDMHIINTVIARHDVFSKRASATAAGWLTVHQYDDTKECIDKLKQQDYRVLATHLGQQATGLYELDLTQPTALVFGNEHSGITDECLTLCDSNFVIPQVGMIRSLNISVACAVSLYEAHRQRTVAGFYGGDTRLPKAQYDGLLHAWSQPKRRD